MNFINYIIFIYPYLFFYIFHTYIDIRAKEIDRVLEAAANEEVQMRKYQTQELKSSWEASINTQKPPKVKDYEPRKFGPSSFQVFDGEDVLAEEREKVKKDQVRRWTQEQLAEKSSKKMQDIDDDFMHADMLKQIDVIRAQAEEDEKQMHRALKQQVTYENSILVESQRLKKDMLNHSKHFQDDGRPVKTGLNIDEPAFCADGSLRKDTFRGYTPAQRRKLLQENEYLRADKLARDQEEKSSDREWAISQAFQLRAMEQANYEEQELKKYQQEQCRSSLREQADIDNEQKRIEKAEYRGAISNEFFENFGKSCR